MSNRKNLLIRQISGFTLSALLILTGVLLMVACTSVYRIGDRPFTPENISAAFSKIAVPVFITLSAILACAVLWLIFPVQQKKPRAAVPQRVTLARLEAKLDPVDLQPVQGIKTLRLWLLIGTAVLCAGLALPALIYALNFNRYSADYNASIIAVCLWMLPFIACSAGLWIAFSFVDAHLLDRQIGKVRELIAASGATRTAAKAPVRSMRGVVLGVRIALAVLAAALIVAGIVNGGMTDVLNKAINICTECIGLG